MSTGNDRLTAQQIVDLLHVFVAIDLTLDEEATARELGRLFNRIYVLGQEHERRKWRAGRVPHGEA